MPKIGTADRHLLRALFASDEAGVELYKLHQEFSLSLAQLARSTQRVLALGIATFNEQGVVFATERGKRWIFENRAELFLKTEIQYWKMVPSRYFSSNTARFRIIEKDFDKSFFTHYINE